MVLVVPGTDVSRVGCVMPYVLQAGEGIFKYP
jgi:hypothetical protein